jgi:predicted neutral ceramidase superfamily lipid hydrolase
LLISGAVYLICSFIALDTQPIVEVKNIAKRTILLFVIIALAVAIGHIKILQALFDRLEPVAFLAYLSHVLLAKLVWIAMSAAGINMMDRSYLIYFFTAPIIVYIIVLPMQSLILTLPALPQILLRGKSTQSSPKTLHLK